MRISDIAEETRIAAGGVGDFARGLMTPTVRLGVTGLARSGKTVFTTALIHNLLRGGRLPMLDAAAEGRLTRAYLQPQPDFDLPRFPYERHLETLTGEERDWPQSTRRISQLRLTIEYEPTGFFSSRFSSGRLNVDIIDYPGEWLLDLPMLTKDFAEWSGEMLELSEHKVRAPFAGEWRDLLEANGPAQDADEATARELANAFTAYLSACRAAEPALSIVPPGRFLMPGDLEGSPLLTFCPMPPASGERPGKQSLWGMMEARYDAYRRHVVQPFFRNHFARLDRQIVLIDVLSAMNAGPHAIEDLQMALTDILGCFRPGRNSWLSAILGRKIERVLFAATKADHLHQTSHDRLEAVMERLVAQAAARAEIRNAEVDALALAAIRATREAQAGKGDEQFDCIVGTPMPGEKIGRKTYDGGEEAVIFPGDLPESADELLAAYEGMAKPSDAPFNFIRFRPPLPRATSVPSSEAPLPHIRLDRALNFLLGDFLE